MVEVTNTTRRNRVVMTAKGTHATIAPGETKDLEMTEASGEHYEKYGKVHPVVGGEPKFRPVLQFGKGKLAPTPEVAPSMAQPQPTSPKSKK